MGTWLASAVSCSSGDALSRPLRCAAVPSSARPGATSLTVRWATACFTLAFGGPTAVQAAVARALMVAGRVNVGIGVAAVAPGGPRTDVLDQRSVRRNHGTLVDIHAGTVGRALDRVDEIAGTRIGDSVRTAGVVIAAGEADQPPPGRPFGSHAVLRARANAAAIAAEMALRDGMTLGTACSDGEPA